MRTAAARRLPRSSTPRSNPARAKPRRDNRSLPARLCPSQPRRFSVQRSSKSSVPGTARLTNSSRIPAPTSAWRHMPKAFISQLKSASWLTVVRPVAFTALPFLLHIGFFACTLHHSASKTSAAAMAFIKLLESALRTGSRRSTFRSGYQSLWRASKQGSIQRKLHFEVVRA
ncbi:hypothetical protein BKA81DRAFT_214681 [Phyllosticta paracitricarpa]